MEDAHWADEATLDLLVFLGRRVERTRALLIVTYRDDELGVDHPLRAVVGRLPPEAVRRLRLEPLSEAAVAELARRAGPARPPGCAPSPAGTRYWSPRCWPPRTPASP